MPTTKAKPLDGTVLNNTLVGFSGRDGHVDCDECHISLAQGDDLYVRTKQHGMDGPWRIVWVTCPACGPTAAFADPGYLEVEASLTFDPDAGIDGHLVITNARLAEQVNHLDWRL
jgi:hypothetical protein